MNVPNSSAALARRGAGRSPPRRSPPRSAATSRCRRRPPGRPASPPRPTPAARGSASPSGRSPRSTAADRSPAESTTASSGRRRVDPPPARVAPRGRRRASVRGHAALARRAPAHLPAAVPPGARGRREGDRPRRRGRPDARGCAYPSCRASRSCGDGGVGICRRSSSTSATRSSSARPDDEERDRPLAPRRDRRLGRLRAARGSCSSPSRSRPSSAPTTPGSRRLGLAYRLEEAGP